jgi:hypothetical protein
MAKLPSVVQQHKSDYRVHKFKTAQHFMLSIYAHLTQATSGNSLVESLNDWTNCDQPNNLRRLIGFEGQIAGEELSLNQSSFSRANNTRSYQVWLDCFVELLGYARSHCANKLAGLGKIVAVDGSLFDGVAKMAWATYQTSTNKAKGHFFFDLAGLPDKLVLSEGKASEVAILAANFVANVTYLIDRGYNDYDLFRKLSGANAYFVTRLKDGAIVNLPQALPRTLADDYFGIVADQRVQLGQADNTVLLRLVSWRSHEGKLWHFLTNRYDLSAKTIVELYQARWQIEFFFGWIKRHLQLRHWYAYSQNGVQIQLYAALIAFLLLKCWVARSPVPDDCALRIEFVRWLNRHLFDPIHPDQLLDYLAQLKI